MQDKQGKRYAVDYDVATRAYVVVDTRTGDTVRSYGWDKSAADTFADQANVDAFQQSGHTKYVCSGDGPATHVECGYTTDSLDAASRHFDLTGHSVDSAEGTVETDTATRQDTERFYRVTIVDPNDPDDVQTFVTSEDEVVHTYPHWGGKPVITAQNGATVTIEPVAMHEMRSR